MKPTVFIVIGLAGSGKSSVSKAIAVHRRAAYLDKDTLSTGFIRLLLEQRGEDGAERENNEFYQNTIFPVEYATVLGACADNLRLGMSVVIDAPFSRYLEQDDYLERVRTEFAWPDCHVVVVRVRTNEETIRRRVIARGNERDRWKLDNWDEFWALMAARECRWAGAIHLDLDNNGDQVEIAVLEQKLRLALDD